MSLLLLFTGARIYTGKVQDYTMSGTKIVFPDVESLEEENDDDEVFNIIKKICDYL